MSYEEFNRELARRKLQYERHFIDCYRETGRVRLGSCAFLYVESKYFVFVMWPMFKHHTRLYEGPLQELSQEQVDFINHCHDQIGFTTTYQPTKKKEKELAKIQAQVDAAVEKAKHKPLFPTNEKKKLSEDRLISITPNPEIPAFF